jgi:hypothetical protein
MKKRTGWNGAVPKSPKVHMTQRAELLSARRMLAAHGDLFLSAHEKRLLAEHPEEDNEVKPLRVKTGARHGNGAHHHV